MKPRIWRKILILLFVWPAQWPKTSMITTAKRLFPTNLMFLKILICYFVIGSFGHQGYGLKLKGGLVSIDTHYFGLDSHIFRSCSSTIDSLQFGDKKKNFTIQSLFICHYSSVTVHVTIHSDYCLFKGGCPLCSKQVIYIYICKTQLKPTNREKKSFLANKLDE